ncbi:reticulon-3 isoform X3 [Cyprinodon tularosa]|uniref:reticulon-3 isoform X3 n=1 Tax=Cyprinodon tularosa TaxID=77115 RepID=UPI0018E28CAE|nr:reticulon-3 isoform X3 [Cyprinodon tularosa]
MDTQSSQISSSQGLPDGQNSAAKESKVSDSFLSYSPVSLIQSSQDKRGVLGSDKSAEGVASSLRFSSQPGSFSPSNYSTDTSPTDGQDSPIKVSPVSERIKALEALAAKKKEPDFRGNGSFTHLRERHGEKSAPEGSKFAAEGLKSSTESSKAPSEGLKSSTESSKAPSEGLKSSTERSKAPSEGLKSSTESSKSAAEGLKSSTDGSKFAAEGLKSSNESSKFAAEGPQNTDSCADLESPESPFEILGETRKVGEFEETEQWMKAHLPPVPDFEVGGFTKSTNLDFRKETSTEIPPAFADVPDAFMDRPVEGPTQKEEFVEEKKSEVEEFDVSFLPTAYMWDPKGKSSVEDPSNIDSMMMASPAPPAGFGSTSPPSSPPICTAANQNISDKGFWMGDIEQPEANEGDSSGESDDTVIEDHVVVTGSNDTTDPTQTPADASTDKKEAASPKPERRLMQVPTINVIETDEPNYSDEEMELEVEEDDDYEVVKGPDTPEPKPQSYEDKLIRTRPLETEFMEGYSPPSSPVDSESEYSPKHKILDSTSGTEDETSGLKSEVFPNPADKTQNIENEIGKETSPFEGGNEEVDFPDNDDDWSDEAQEILFKPSRADPSSQEPVMPNQPAVRETITAAAEEAYVKPAAPPMSSFMQDDIYDRQSFDYDFDIGSSLDQFDVRKLNAKERFLSDPAQKDDADDKLDLDSAISLNGDDIAKSDSQPSLEDYPENPYSSFQGETMSSAERQEVVEETNVNIHADDEENGNMLASQLDPEGTNVSSSASEPVDSFLEFMRECLKSKQDEETDNVHLELPYDASFPPHSQASPSTATDLEQECLTISALKDLSINQEDEEESVNQNQPKSDFTPTQPPSFSSDAKPPCYQSIRPYSSEVEAIDEWVAEAYHLAEHVLTAILTHLSVHDLIHWRDPKKSGVVFGLSLLLLLSLAAFSVISVISYLLLALLCVTITFRIYKSVIQAVQKSSDGHPFKALIEKDVSIPPETFRKHVDTSLTHINRALKQMSHLFLVEDLVDSLKLAVVMWLMTYVGAVFNGITILILADILLFAVPPIYEKNKTQIDQYIDLIRTQVNNTIAKLQEKLPGAMKRSKAE